MSGSATLQVKPRRPNGKGETKARQLQLVMRHNIRNMDSTMRLDMLETHCAGHQVFWPPLTHAVYRDMIHRGKSEDKDRTRGV